MQGETQGGREKKMPEVKEVGTEVVSGEIANVG